MNCTFDIVNCTLNIVNPDCEKKDPNALISFMNVFEKLLISPKCFHKINAPRNLFLTVCMRAIYFLHLGICSYQHVDKGR